MLGMFCGTNVSSNEEYKKYVKKRIMIMKVLVFIGVVTLGVAMAAEQIWNIQADSYILGVYSGVGSGLMVAGVVLIVKNRRLLQNEEKLRQARVEAYDERNLEINTKATKIALGILLVGMYMVMLIGGLWYPILMRVMSVLVCLFLVAYFVAYKIIEKRV